MTAIRFVLMLACLLGFALVGQCEEESWYPYFEKLAKSYELSSGTSAQPKPLRLRPEPITNWSQPVRGGSQGAVYLWTDGQRPAVIGTLFIWPRGDQFGVCHELQSLSDSAIRGTQGTRVWNCPEGGIKWHRLDDVPAATSSQRQSLQARNLARRFALTSTDRENKTNELRFLPRPLYVYSDQSHSKSYGAIFGYVEGTDLESVVLLESTRNADDSINWRYAFARMSDLSLSAKLDGAEVWSVPIGQYAQSHGAYFCETPEYRSSLPSDER